MHNRFITLAVLAERCLKGLPDLRNKPIGDTVFVALSFGTCHLGQNFAAERRAAA